MTGAAESANGTAAGAEARLSARGIVKRYPGVLALDRVDFHVRFGEVHALVGENGAGKTTLVRVLSGAVAPDAGEIALAGRPIHPRDPHHAQRLGIATMHQEVELIPHLSLVENITIGREHRRLGLIDRRRAQRDAVRALGQLGVRADLRQTAAAAPIALRQMCAIARALEVEARVLILDEPTASLDAEEAARLFGVVRSLAARGLGIVLITHFLDDVFEHSNRVTVLRNGRLVAVHEAAGISRLGLVAEMLGRSIEEVRRLERSHAPAGRTRAGETALRGRGLRRAPRIGPIDIQLRRGEILGLAGLLGSGRTETTRLLAGADRADAGDIEIDGRTRRWRSPREPTRRGVGLLPEDRRSEGIVPALSVRENIVLSLQARRGAWRRISSRAQRELARRHIDSLAIAAPSAETPAGTLSGGNQQKVVLARWLAAEPRVLLLDEPTRGIDVGAKAEIERLVRELCGRGLAILFISSELEEVCRDSDRVLVLRDGRIVGRLGGEGEDRIEQSRVMQLVAGAAEGAGHG